MPKVLILTGPGGSGKSTIAKLIAERCGFVYLDADREDTEFFPSGGQHLQENWNFLHKAHKKILRKTKELADQGKDVVVDYIIFGLYEDFVEMFRHEFGDDLQIKVLMPTEDEVIKRDRDREIWTAGPEQIKAISAELNALKDIVGEENYIDSTRQTPEETFERYFAC